MTQYDPGHNKGTESRFVFGWEGGVVGWGVGGGGVVVLFCLFRPSLLTSLAVLLIKWFKCAQGTRALHLVAH